MLTLGIIRELRYNYGYTWRVIIVLSDLSELNDIEGSCRVVKMRDGLSLSEVLSALSQVEIYFLYYKTNYFHISIDSFSITVFTSGCVYLSIDSFNPLGRAQISIGLDSGSLN